MGLSQGKRATITMMFGYRHNPQFLCFLRVSRFWVLLLLFLRAYAPAFVQRAVAMMCTSSRESSRHPAMDQIFSYPWTDSMSLSSTASVSASFERLSTVLREVTALCTACFGSGAAVCRMWIAP